MDIFDLGFIMAIIAVISFVISTGITDIFLDTAKIIDTRNDEINFHTVLLYIYNRNVSFRKYIAY